MMRHAFVMGFAFAGFQMMSACSSTTSSEMAKFAEPAPIIASVIKDRIEQIPFQHREELLENMLWLKAKGELAIPSLIRALDHKDPKVRSSAAWVLGMIGDKRAIPYLRKHSGETHPVTRLEIARSLLSLGDYSMVPTLIAGLEDEHTHIRFLCIEALRQATGKRFGYDHLTKDESLRKSGAEKWKAWWASKSKDPFFGASAVPAAPGGR